MLLLVFSLAASAQIQVNGVVDKGVYSDRVSLAVVSQPGFRYDIKLNTNTLLPDASVLVDRPDYYELRVRQIHDQTSAVTDLLLRFIVKDTARLDTEWGLPSHIPAPVIQSSAPEFSGGHLLLIAPRAFPAGYEIPVIAWAEDENGHAVRANGLLSAPGHPNIQLRRGVGSGFLAATNGPGLLEYAPELQGLTTNKIIAIEGGTSWTEISGTLSGIVEWPANSRIHVTTNLVISTGTTLTIGAGSILLLNYRTDITNNGTIVMNGTVDDPIVFMPNAPGQPWGGFLMRNNTGSITGEGVIFTGSGAVSNWFGSSGNPGSHRKEQALFFLQQSQSVALSNSAAISLAGQFGHSVAGGTYSFGRFLMERTTTGGEFTGASFSVNDSAFIECPADTPEFVDGDNDALYLVSGTHGFTNTLFGWTKDDGVDSGGDGVGRLHYERCWFESTFHEGNSLSGLKNTTAHDTIYLDCGQGLEDGYGAGTGGPTGRVDRCVFAYCEVGARHGDNYPSIGNGYPGVIAATNSIFLHNHHDIFGYDWRTSGWTNAVGQMSFSSNLLTSADSDFPNNDLWEPARDGALLSIAEASGVVGLGFSVRPGQVAADFPEGLPISLSAFCTNEVVVDYAVDTSTGFHSSGTLRFAVGQLRSRIPLPQFVGVLRVGLSDPKNAEITGPTSLYFQSFGQSDTSLISYGSKWNYLDDGSDLGSVWRANDFDDTGWRAGLAELGFGDQDEATPIRSTNSLGHTNITFYFRRPLDVGDPNAFSSLRMSLRRDDGGVVYIHGAEVYRSPNMPAGTITSSTFATSAGENTVDTTNLPPSVLRPGTNVVAVEIHQQSLASSDVSFDFELVGTATPPSPWLESVVMSGELVLYWVDPALVLEASDDLTSSNWTPMNCPSPVAVLPTGVQKFFRLKQAP
jgi:hypothetical protein